VDDNDRVKTVIRSDVPNQPPLAGEVPFFLGVNHLNAIKAADDVVDVELLVNKLQLDKSHKVRTYQQLKVDEEGVPL
jgi:hypothetical protein